MLIAIRQIVSHLTIEVMIRELRYEVCDVPSRRTDPVDHTGLGAFDVPDGALVDALLLDSVQWSCDGKIGN